jgi:beta-galactosidase
MTEFHYPDIKNEIHQNLTKYRAGSFWDVVVKSLLLLNYNFDATDLQKKDLDPNKLCILPSASYMPKDVQQKLVDFLKQDGKLLLYGELPRFDLEGNSCTLLVDYFNLEFIRNEEHKQHTFRTSIVAHQFISDRPELHRPYYQTWKSKDEKDILFSVYHLNEACGFFFNEPKKHAALITAEYRSDFDMFDQIIKLFGIEKRIHVTNNLYHGLFAIETKNELGEGYLHLINLDDFDKTFDISTPTIQNKSLYIEQRSALMLPINLEIVNGLTIRYSSNEIQYFDEEKIIISLNGPTFECMIDTHKEILSNDPTVEIVRNKTSVFIRKSKRYYDEKTTELLIK